LTHRYSNTGSWIEKIRVDSVNEALSESHCWRPEKYIFQQRRAIAEEWQAEHSTSVTVRCSLLSPNLSWKVKLR